MADQFTAQVTDIRQRLGVKESEGLDGSESISRIQKSYLRIGLRLKVAAYVHQYEFATDPTILGNHTNPEYASESNYI